MAPRRKLKQSQPQPPPPISTPFPQPDFPLPVANPPSRSHTPSYHYPLLLTSDATCTALLEWFESVEDSRSMPWRKKWVDPGTFEGGDKELGETLAKRAYEVWVSEVMLQQTRVSTVIPYFNNWISKWPTVYDLANANHDEVLSVWKGLGYYSRATRLHEGAKAVISNHQGPCPIPSSAEELQQLPGIGRYTAGAISSIAFGEAEPVLDGNVARVLSRQLALRVDAKDKKATDILWSVADQIIKKVSDFPDITKSAVPGQWNQALMELGSTICTPRPKCDECPIQKTCRAYAEGLALSGKPQKTPAVVDIEDACTLCEPLDTDDLVLDPEEDVEEEEAPVVSKKRKIVTKQSNTISRYFAVGPSTTKPDVDSDKGATADAPQTDASKKRKVATATAKSKSVALYCSLFPKKPPKKKVAEEECVVCIIELQSDGDSQWLIEQRPAKGLLGSLWQFPQSPIPASKSSAPYRKTSAQEYVSSLEVGDTEMTKTNYVVGFEPLVHVFSHIKLTMHVHHFRYLSDKDACMNTAVPGLPARRWIKTESMDEQTLSTGMRRCWELVQKSL